MSDTDMDCSLGGTENPTETAREWNVGQDDPHDHYPWLWKPYTDDDGGPEMGSICTPNGHRPDGSMHTYWSIAAEVWEPTGQLICRLVNQWAHERFGTPRPSSPENVEGET